MPFGMSASALSARIPRGWDVHGATWHPTTGPRRWSRGRVGEPVTGCPGSDLRVSVPSLGDTPAGMGVAQTETGAGLGHTHEHAERYARIVSAHRTVARPDTLGVRAARRAREHAFSGLVACRTCHAASGVRRHGHRHRALAGQPRCRYLQRPSSGWGAQRGVRGAWSGTLARSVPMPQALTEGGRRSVQ